MKTTESLRTSIVLLEEEGERPVFVIPKDRDKFFVTVQQAVEACGAYGEALRFEDQFLELLESLTNWIEPRRDRIKAAHVTIRENDILFLIMQKDTKFDRELADEITSLDLEIANSEALGLINLNVLAVPAVSKDSALAFLSSGQVLTYAK